MTQITIKDVAARAGVSAKTVSRVINGEAHVRPPVRDAVMRVVREMGYRPNSYARGLSSSKSYLLGLLVDDPSSGYAADVQFGALMRSHELGYHLVIEAIPTAAPDWLDSTDTRLKALNLAGAILTPPLCDDADLALMLERHGIPHVRISPRDPNACAGSVQMNDRAAAHDMTRHLIALGHRTIGFIKGDPAHSVAPLRFAGFEDAMNEAGLHVDGAHVLEGDFSFRSGLALGETMLAQLDRPSAVFASNDDMALGILVAAIRYGITVPDELSIAGFDDGPVARVCWPQLTTIRQPKVEMAAAAVDILVDPAFAVPLPKTGFNADFPYELIIRASTGPYPKL